MTVDKLHELIAGAVALATASAKDADGGTPDAISQAARSVAEAAHHATHSDLSSKDGARAILWVDDRPDNNIHERAAFESTGFHFTLALSTQEALDRLKTRRFAAIISDMGRRDGPREGYVLLEGIRSKGNETPFFIYAGSNAPEHKREAEERGAQGSTNRAQELFELVTQAVA